MDYQFKAGSIPLLVSMPHVGTDIPDDVLAAMTPAAVDKQDTDWHLVRLYEFLSEMGASTLSARWSRYVIDLNRPPENTNLYPGQDTTGLCPVDTFHREPLYREGRAPDEAEVQRRLQAYWKPYHDQLRAELDRLLALHGRVVLWDAHSIASHVPRFFEGKLPDLNFGTADGKSCDVGLSDAIVARASDSTTPSPSTAASRAGISRAFTASRQRASTRSSWRCASPRTWTKMRRMAIAPIWRRRCSRRCAR
jgi:N-formylglutamate deformylase